MSFNNKFFSALTVAFALFAFSSFATAQESTTTDSDQQQKREWRRGKRDGGGKGFRRGGFGALRGLREVNLTDAQKEQIRTIMEANRPDQSAMEEMRTLRQAKRDGTLTADQQDRLKAIREQSKLKSETVQQQILAILTVEQRQQLEVKKAEMQQKREERRQQRRERRQQQTPQTEDNDN